MGQASIATRLAPFKAVVKERLTVQQIEEILAVTLFSEDEIFLLLDRFIELEPDEAFQINLNKLKKLREFLHNPFRDLILNAMRVYPRISDYYKKSSEHLHELYKKKATFDVIGEEVDEEEEYEDEDEDDPKNNDESKDGASRDQINQDKTSKKAKEEEEDANKFELAIEDPNDERNTNECITFKLFCEILNMLHIKYDPNERYKMAFYIFDLNEDGFIDMLDLKRVYKIIFRGFHSPDKEKELNIENMAKNILLEFKVENETLESTKITFNNFQKIILSSNFLNNLVFIP